MRNILKKISAVFSAPGQKPEYLEYKIRCNNCGETVNVKVFLERDLNPTYEDSGPAYILKKEVMDSVCFRIMIFEAEFDSSGRELNRTIEGGTFLE